MLDPSINNNGMMEMFVLMLSPSLSYADLLVTTGTPTRLPVREYSSRRVSSRSNCERTRFSQ